MNDQGVFLIGLFCGTDMRQFVRQADGRQITVHYVLLVNGSDFYRISFDKDVSDPFVFGDKLKIRVRPSVYKEGIYWNGLEIESC